MLPETSLVKCKDADYLLFSNNDHITQHLLKLGVWEEHLLSISEMLTQGVKEPLILDIGANLGAYAIPMAKKLASTKGALYAFEPQRIVYYQLCGNIFVNSIDNIFAYCMAIGDTDGWIAVPEVDYEKTVNIAGFSVVDDIRNKTKFVTLKRNESPVQTPISRLDSIPFPRPPCLIKIDVEGFELNVLAGSVTLLENSHFPPLLFEAWNWEWFAGEKSKLFDFLLSIGYEITSVFKDDYVAQHAKHPIHVDFYTDGKGNIGMNRVR